MSEDEGILLIFPEYMVPITQLRGPGDTLAVAGKLDHLLVLLSEKQKKGASESFVYCERLHIFTYTSFFSGESERFR